MGRVRILLYIVLSLGILYGQTHVSQSTNKQALFIRPHLEQTTGYSLLQTICYEAGGRLAGSKQNIRALQIILQALNELGMKGRLEWFRMPGWQRGVDSVLLLNPQNRLLSAIALGYVSFREPIKAHLMALDSLTPKDTLCSDFQGKIILIELNRVQLNQKKSSSGVINLLSRLGARAVLFLNRRAGGIHLAGISNFQGEDSKIPAFSISREDGLYLRYLYAKGYDPELEIRIHSYCKPVETANLVLDLPGIKDDYILVGAHVDSWDIGQGAVDNGVGTAILFELARILQTDQQNRVHGIRLVWFNGEELGLWGAKHYLDKHDPDSVLLMFNLDMCTKLTGFNIMGFKCLQGYMDSLIQDNNLFSESKYCLISKPWFHSDHQPFMERGIPIITPTAILSEDQQRFYHTRYDTFDKINGRDLEETAQRIATLLNILAEKDPFPCKMGHQENANRNQY